MNWIESTTSLWRHKHFPEEKRNAKFQMLNILLTFLTKHTHVLARFKSQFDLITKIIFPFCWKCFYHHTFKGIFTYDCGFWFFQVQNEDLKLLPPDNYEFNSKTGALNIKSADFYDNSEFMCLVNGKTDGRIIRVFVQGESLIFIIFFSFRISLNVACVALSKVKLKTF